MQNDKHGLGCLRGKFQAASLPSWTVQGLPYPYKGTHCSLGVGLGEFPSSIFSLLYLCFYPCKGNVLLLGEVLTDL